MKTPTPALRLPLSTLRSLLPPPRRDHLHICTTSSSASFLLLYSSPSFPSLHNNYHAPPHEHVVSSSLSIISPFSAWCCPSCLHLRRLVKAEEQQAFADSEILLPYLPNYSSLCLQHHTPTSTIETSTPCTILPPREFARQGSTAPSFIHLLRLPSLSSYPNIILHCTTTTSTIILNISTSKTYAHWTCLSAKCMSGIWILTRLTGTWTRSSIATGKSPTFGLLASHPVRSVHPRITGGEFLVLRR